MADFKVSYKGNFSTEMIHLESGEKIMTDAPKDNQGLGRTFSPTDLINPSHMTTIPFSMVLPGAAWMVALVNAHARGGFRWSALAGPTCAVRMDNIDRNSIVFVFIIRLKSLGHVSAWPLFFLLSIYMHHQLCHRFGTGPNQIERLHLYPQENPNLPHYSKSHCQIER